MKVKWLKWYVSSVTPQKVAVVITALVVVIMSMRRATRILLVADTKDKLKRE